MPAHPISVSPAAVARVLGAAVCFLALAHIGVMLAKYVAGYPTLYGLVPLFDLNSEQSMPTYFGASLHLAASALLAVIAMLKKRSGGAYAAQWTILAIGFLFMAFDEAAGLHELMGRPMEELLGRHATGLFHFAWVIPGMIIVLALAVWFLKFLLHLPPQTRWLFLTAGALFVGGAVGVELFEGRHVALHGAENLTFAAYVLVEETLEMSGIVLFIYALLRYIAGQYREVHFRLGEAEERAAAATSQRDRASAH